MNIQDFIQSGTLEAYVLGELSAQDQAEVERLAAAHPAVREELDRIEEDLATVAQMGQKAPRAGFEAAFFERFDQLYPEQPPVAAPEQPKAAAETVVRALPQSRPSYWQWVAAAAVVFGLASSATALYFRAQWQQTESQLVAALAQQQVVADQYNQVNQQLGRIESDLSIVHNPAFAKVAMPGTAQSPQSAGVVYWNAQTAELYLSVVELKQLSQEQQYQLWAIIDGKPVDAGVFDATDNSLLVKMKDIPAGAQAFAVTVEPRGGNASPSLETMQVFGAVKAG